MTNGCTAASQVAWAAIALAWAAEAASGQATGAHFPWERGVWARQSFTLCDLAEELGPEAMHRSLLGCPMATCLTYGVHRGKPIVNEIHVKGMTELFERGTRISGSRSECYRVPGLPSSSSSSANHPQMYAAVKAAQQVGFDDDNVTVFCAVNLNSGRPHMACCDGQYNAGAMADSNEGRTVCAACLPAFMALGPEKTGTTDLYNRLSILDDIVPATQKETGWWVEGIVGSNSLPFGLAGYGLRYFSALSKDVALGTLPTSTQCGELSSNARGSHLNACKQIAGEATPYMLYRQHYGLSLIPRWLACTHPTVKLIVTWRDPASRTYSDYHFFGKLQATKLHLSKSEASAAGKTREQVEAALLASKLAFVRNLTARSFHESMRREISELENCFTVDSDGRLWWAPQPSQVKLCEGIRAEQLGKLAFTSSRPAGRLLVSLYPMHLARWARYFPCDQLLVVHGVGGQWDDRVIQAIATFLGVTSRGATMAGAAGEVRPEDSIHFNEAGFSLARQAGVNAPPKPMFESTRALLEKFFEKHWHARFPPELGQHEPCALENARGI